jgi:flavin-binding protein dodecin
VRDIKEIYIKDMNGIVENNEIKMFRITAKISFLLSD